jgi:outer membrane protein OmpA-like peptidoglycan-associated protein
MRRAQTVRVLLMRAGIAADRIQVASLGQRRPLDFSLNETANELNRRVEILLPTATAGRLKFRAPSRSHVLPDCGGSQ